MIKVGVEFLGFTAAALAAHLVVLAAVAPDGAASGGAGGDAALSMTAPLGSADADLAALVDAWAQRPSAPPPAEAPDAPMADAAPTAEVATTPDVLPGLPQPRQSQAPEPSLAAAPPPPPLFDRPDTPPRTRPEPRRARPQAAPTAPARGTGGRAPATARAAGTGAADESGQARAPVHSGGSGNDASALAQWGGGIRAAIQRQQPAAGRAGRGTVQLRLAVHHDGRLAQVSVTAGSGQGALDQAAIAAVRRARLPRAPQGVSAGVHHFNLPLNFR